jgi:hypothetical protein
MPITEIPPPPPEPVSIPAADAAVWFHARAAQGGRGVTRGESGTLILLDRPITITDVTHRDLIVAAIIHTYFHDVSVWWYTTVAEARADWLEMT